MLTIGWSDGNSFIPVGYSLLSAAEDKKLLCKARSYDGHSLAGRRRRQSSRKASDVMLELIASAQAAGLTAKYVLSVDVSVEKDGNSLLAKLVFVRNKDNRMDWLALISTDTGISEEALSI